MYNSLEYPFLWGWYTFSSIVTMQEFSFIPQKGIRKERGRDLYVHLNMHLYTEIFTWWYTEYVMPISVSKLFALSSNYKLSILSLSETTLMVAIIYFTLDLSSTSVKRKIKRGEELHWTHFIFSWCTSMTAPGARWYYHPSFDFRVFRWIFLNFRK